MYALSSGTVIKKLVKEGDSVVKNDAAIPRLQVAQANYQIAQANLSAHSRIF